MRSHPRYGRRLSHSLLAQTVRQPFVGASDRSLANNMTALIRLTLPLFLISTLLGADNAYLAAGIASTHREWRGKDCSDFAAALTAGTVPLPKLSEKPTAAVLNRFCSPGNLVFGKDTKIPLSVRFQDFLQLQQSVGAIVTIYSKQAEKGDKVADELTLLLGYLLQTSALGINLADELLPTIPHDASYETRMTGFNRMKAGLTTVFVGAYTSVADDTIYSEQNRSDLLSMIAQTSPDLVKAMSLDVRTEMILKYTQLKARMKSSRDQESISEIIKALNS